MSAGLSWGTPEEAEGSTCPTHICQKIQLGDITCCWPYSGPSTYATCCDSGQSVTACHPILACHQSGPPLNEVVPGVGDTWHKPECRARPTWAQILFLLTAGPSGSFSVLGESTWTTVFLRLFQGWAGGGSTQVNSLPPRSQRGPQPASRSCSLQ